jgi:signal recognition particle subunit SRP68
MNRDVVRIYDTILQSTKQLVELPGVHNDEELHSALTIVDNYFKLQRTNVIAKTYGICGNKNEALALYKRSLSYFETDVVSINIELPGSIVSQADIDSALGQTRFEFARAHALANLNDQASSTTTKKVKGVDNDNTVINSLFDYPGGEPEQVVKRLVDFNYKLQPVPVKPVFFDIAYNYIDYNEQEKAKVMQQDEPRQQQQQQQKKGFLGLWR